MNIKNVLVFAFGIAVIIFAFVTLFVINKTGVDKSTIYFDDNAVKNSNSIAWYFGSEDPDNTWDNNFYYTNELILPHDFKVLSSISNSKSVFDKCRPVTLPDIKYYENRYSKWLGEYVDIDACIMDVKTEDSIDSNGCRTVTRSYYNGVKKQVSGCGAQGACCYRKNELRGDYYTDDNAAAGQIIQTSGGSDNAITWGCFQTLQIYKGNVMVMTLDLKDKVDMLFDLDNNVVSSFSSDILRKETIRLRSVRNDYVGSPYYRCYWIQNEALYNKLECLTDSECNDNNAYTINDSCVNNNCKTSEPVQCLTDTDCTDNNPYTANETCILYNCMSETLQCVSESDCKFYENCEANKCTIKQEYLDSDKDGVINKNDKCPTVYGTGSDGCKTFTERIRDIINSIIEYFKSFIKR